MSEFTEDDLVTALLEQDRWNREGVEAIPEAHFNHYGDRGVVDLVRIDEARGEITLREIKSASAIKNHETGANSIIRQFNKMRKYFFKDDSWVPPLRDEERKYGSIEKSTVNFHIEFIACSYCIQHIVENASIYEQCVKNQVFDTSNHRGNIDVTRGVFLRHPEQPGQGYILLDENGRVSLTDMIRDELAKVGVNADALEDF